jgi:LPS-assembly protein
MWRFGDYYTGDVLKLNMETGKGFLLNPYRFEVGHGQRQGRARRLHQSRRSQCHRRHVQYLRRSNPDWYLKSSTLNLDTGRDVGTGARPSSISRTCLSGHARHSFSLSGARRSAGWRRRRVLPRSGFELTVPYYLNIAPNRDLTLYPKYIQRRGIQLGAIGRYMGETDAGLYSGETSFEFLPNDKQTKTNRYMIKSKHEQALAGLDLRLGCARRIGQYYPVISRKTWRRRPSASCCANCAPITTPRTGA